MSYIETILADAEKASTVMGEQQINAYLSAGGATVTDSITVSYASFSGELQGLVSALASELKYARKAVDGMRDDCRKASRATQMSATARRHGDEFLADLIDAILEGDTDAVSILMETGMGFKESGAGDRA